jgi:hypothetical protein
VHIPAADTPIANVPRVAFIPPFVGIGNPATRAAPDASPCPDTGRAPVEWQTVEEYVRFGFAYR